MSTVLLIPPDGLLEILQSNRPIVTRSWLEDHGDGKYVSLAITLDGAQRGTVDFLLTDEGVLNLRARDVLARLTGVHVILTGNVAFTGLHPDTVIELIEEVG